MGALTFNLRVFGVFFAESTQFFVPFPPCIELTHRDVRVKSYGLFKGYLARRDFLLFLAADMTQMSPVSLRPGRNPELFGQKNAESPYLFMPFLPCIELINREVGITSNPHLSLT